jgi:transposase
MQSRRLRLPSKWDGALGRKNRLFFGDADAGERKAIIESCRRHGIEPSTYLHDALTRLPSMTNRQIKDVVPKAWASSQEKHCA